MGRTLPNIELQRAMRALDNQPPPSGIAPAGVQQVVTVRDGASMTFGLGPLTSSQPGVVEDEPLFWGVSEDRSCLVAATSRGALVDALGDDTSDSNDPRERSAAVDAESSIYPGQSGELVTTIPQKARPSHVPVPDGVRDLVDVGSIPTPDVPDPAPGTVYLLVAEHYANERRQETAFLFLPIHRVAAAVTLENLRGAGGRFEQPLVTTSDLQARVLLGLVENDRRLRRYRATLETATELPSDIHDTVVHSGTLGPHDLLAAFRRLENLGAVAFCSG